MEESTVRAHSQAQVKMQPVRDQVMRHSTFFFLLDLSFHCMCLRRWHHSSIKCQAQTHDIQLLLLSLAHPPPPPTMKYVAHTLFPSQLLRSRWSEFSCEISPAAQSSSSNLKLLINNLSQAVANLKKKNKRQQHSFPYSKRFLVGSGREKGVSVHSRFARSWK